MVGKKYFIAGAVLCGLSLVALIVGIAVSTATDAGIGFFFIMLAVCIVTGYIANILIRKVSGGGKKAGAVFVLSYLQYLAPFAIVWLIKQIATLIKSLFSIATSNSTADTVYTIHDDYGFERKLTFFDYGTDSEGVQFKKYRDDIGNYWRTYDDGSTFVRDSSY